MKLAMLTSAALSIVAAAAFASPSATAPAPEKSGGRKSCCAKKSADAPMKCEKPAATTDGANHAGHEKHKMRCSLTGKVVHTCCCVEREGKTHCTLADKDVAECCCTPVEDEKAAAAKTN
jgi:hypothetical protein